MIYLNSARSFSSKLIGNKIESIKASFEKQVNLILICGKDYVFWRKNSVNYGNSGVANSIESLIIKRYISEILDVFHDCIIFIILFSYGNNKLLWERGSRLHISGLLFSKIKKLTYIYEWKDNLYQTKFNLLGYLHVFYEYLQVKYSDYIVVESDILKKELVNKFNIKDSKVYVAYNCIDPNIFKGNFKRSNESNIVVGYIGSFAFYHNVNLLADLINNLDNTEIMWEFIGAGGNLSEVQRKLKFSSHNISFIKPVSGSDVPCAISHWSIAVLPGSTDIISPIKITEFLSLGLPVIVPNSPAIIEQFSNNYALVYFEKNDQISLKNALLYALSNLNELIIKANHDIPLISKNFSFDGTWGKILSEIISNEKK